jgi:proteasome lid subunit RPN8/RPN11
VPAAVIEGMVAQAVAELPNECCGVLAGRVEGDRGVVVSRHPLINAAASPRLFESDARSTFDALRAVDRAGLEVLAVYHSHPTSAPVPSRTDLERNWSSDVVNLIVSLAGPRPEVRAWWLTETDYREAEWEVVDLSEAPAREEEGGQSPPLRESASP